MKRCRKGEDIFEKRFEDDKMNEEWTDLPFLVGTFKSKLWAEIWSICFILIGKADHFVRKMSFVFHPFPDRTFQNHFMQSGKRKSSMRVSIPF